MVPKLFRVLRSLFTYAMGRPVEPRAYLFASVNGRLCELRIMTDRAEILAATGWTMPPEYDAALVVTVQGAPMVFAGTREQLADVLSRWQVALLRIPTPNR